MPDSKQNKYPASFKATVALESLKADQTTITIAARYSVSEQEVSDWQTVLLENAASLFADGHTIVHLGDDALDPTELAQTIAENSTLGFALMDRKGYCIYANSTWLQMTGYSEQEISARPLHYLVHHHHPDGRFYPMEDCPIDRALPEHFDVRAHEDLFFRKDGSSFPVQCAASPVFKHGRPVATVIEIKDITREKEVEQLQRNAERRKDEFLATLAHELRNPLAPISTGVEVLQRTLPRDPRTQQILAVMERQTSHLTCLVDDLLEISRISQGKLTLRMETVNVQETIQYALDNAKAFTHKRKLTLALPDAAVFVRADRVRLVQMLGNLISNAGRYSNDGDDICISLSVEDGSVNIAVRDSGIGMRPETIDKLFQMFMQVDPTKAGGLGIGLALVRSLADLHGGTVAAQSEGLGKGSEFIITLPATEGTAVVTSHDTGGDRSMAGLRVLVVDDNQDAADTLSLLLTAARADVRTVYDGARALQIIADDPPQVVLLDLGMPELDGFEVARRIRARRNGNIRLIAVTGWGQAHDRQKTRAAGFDGHLMKPIDFEDLAGLLQTLGLLRPDSSSGPGEIR